ncbi:MAG: carboxypeptidase regulatory-like domain-containing protein [Verrucomicrobiota bacterium]
MPAFLCVLALVFPTSPGAAEEARLVPYVGQAAWVGATPPVRDLRPAPGPRAKSSPSQVREVPRYSLPRNPLLRKTLGAERPDPVVQRGPVKLAMPTPLLTFEGVGNIDGVLPSDSNGDVGLDQYLEMVNFHFRVFDKETGTPLTAPLLMSDLFAAAGFPAPASTTDDGDPVVLYDHLANRWLISQFIVSVTPPHEVMAVSQTADATGSWYLYDFVMPNTKMNDYPKLGVWPDGYYMTDNQFQGFSWAGAGVFVFDRAKMLAGDPTATYQYFDLYGVDPNFGGLLPSDLDGPPPPEGAPNCFLMVDDSFVNPADAMYFWEFHVDWTNSANTTFGNNGSPSFTNAVAAFDSAFAGGRNNIPQPGTSQKLDALADRLMHRAQYRCFGSYETLVASHTVDADGNDHAGVRYYEFRRPLPGGTFSIHEQATYAPDAHHRWMGSAAMDGQGNLAVGFSVSSTSVYPSIRYAGRLATDPPNGLYQGESELYAGSGSQTHSAARWGDYSMLSVDPVDNVTFWYVNEYLPATSVADWHTRIGSFRLGSRTIGTLMGVVTDSLSGAAIEGASVTTTNFYSTITTTGGHYALQLPTGTYSVAASALFYHSSSPVAVLIEENATTLQDFAISPVPLRVVPATGFGASGPEGGPFAPPGETYALTNTSLSSLSWTAIWSAAWLDVAPQGGTLPQGGAVAVAATLNHEADFLGTGVYSASLVFSNTTSGEVEVRPVTLSVQAYAPPALACFDFEGGLPAGWTVLTNGANMALASWQFNDPGNRGNLTGGDGVFAVVDSDLAGPTTSVDTAMNTESFDCSAYGEVVLEFKMDYFDYEVEHAEIDVSTNGAAGPWVNVWAQSGSDLRGPRTVTTDISAEAAGSSNVMLRFHYYDLTSWGWWWEVDDVCLRARPPEEGNLKVQPLSGMAASGYHGGAFHPDRVYRLTNAAVSSISWTALWAEAWFDVNPPGGSLPPGQVQQVTVNVSSAANVLAPGAYSDTLSFYNETEDESILRPVDLTVLEPMQVSPTNGLTSSGLEGGPFNPTGRLYGVANLADHAVTWTALWNEAWIVVDPPGGTLAAGTATSVWVTLDADSLTPAIYQDSVIFSNTASGSTASRTVTLRVIEITGEMDIFDSIPPTNDLYMPFGSVVAGAPHTETVTVVNTHGSLNLIISNVFFSYHQENFNDGTADDFVEDIDANWNVVAGEYRAASALTEFMTAHYQGSSWDDASVSARVRREGDPNWSHGLILRASADHDVTGTGTAYLFLLSDSYYSVLWQNGATFGALQGWSLSMAIQGQTNTLTASAEGAHLRFFINGTQVWEGNDPRFTNGYAGVCGYSQASAQTTHYFDDFIVDLPIQVALGLGRKQRYLNGMAEETSRPERANHKTVPPKIPPHLLGEGDGEAPYPLSLTSSGPFSLDSLPALPATLLPGQSYVFTVQYAPIQVGSNRAVITVKGNDNDEPEGHVFTDGHAASGVLTGQVTAAHSGDPIAGATVTADNGVTNWSALTDISGRYRMGLLLGTYDVRATADDYATQTVSGVDFSSDGQIIVQDFVLSGSLLTYAPPAIHEDLLFGQRVTNAVWMTNSGPLDVGFSLVVAGCSGPMSPIHLAPSDGTFPRGPDAASVGRGPALLSPSLPGPRAPVPDVPCFGVDMLAQNLVSFTTEAPGTFHVIAPSGGNFIPSIEFLNGDFTVLYGIDGDANALVWFDTATGARTVIGTMTPLSGQSWTGLAGDPTDGKLYASSTDITASHLYTIDPATGAATWIGLIRNAPGMIDIAINAAGDLYGLDIVNDNLIAINKATGDGTVVGSIGFDANYAQDMDFDELSGTLFLAAFNNSTYQGELRVADTATGNSTLVAPFENGSELCMAVATGGGGCQWVSLSAESGTIPPGGSTSVDVIFDAGEVVQTGTYSSAISFRGSFVNAVTNLPLSMTVLPDDLTVSPLDGLSASGPRGGPFAPTGIVYAVTNQGAGSVDWAAQCAASWLSVAPTGGTLSAGASVAVTGTINSAAAFLSEGTYEDTLHIINQNSGAIQNRAVALEVGPPTPTAFLCIPLDTSPGWSTEGQWAFGHPTGGGSHCLDPAAGHTGTNVYGYNLAGDYVDNMPAYYLTSTPLDCSGFQNVHLQFWRWLGVESSIWDGAAVEASTNGVDWITAWEHSGSSFCDGTWVQVSYDISGIADTQAAVYLRWRMGPTDSSVTYPGWNIDDICLLGNSTDDLVVTPTNELSARGFEGGPFSPTGIVYTLWNYDASPVNWTVSCTSAWLSVTPPSGTLPPATTTNVLVAFSAASASLTAGTYSCTVTFSNMNSGATLARDVSVYVCAPHTNLLNNWSFEIAGSTADTAAYWEWNVPDQHGSFWDTAARVDWRHYPTNEGAWCGAIRGSWFGGLTSGGFWQEVPAVPGGHYAFSAWFWADDGNPFGPWTASNQVMKLEFYSPPGYTLVKVVTQQVAVFTQIWEQVTLHSIAPAGCDWVRVVVAADGVGNMGALSLDALSLDGGWPDLQIQPAADVSFSGEEGGPFLPSSSQYEIVNRSAGSLPWTVRSSVEWLNLSTSGGTLSPGATQTMSFAVTADAGFLPPGQYPVTLLFSNSVNGITDTRGVVLNVLTNPPFGCAVIISEYVEGTSYNKALEIFNGTGAAIDLNAGGYYYQAYHNGAVTPNFSIALTGTVAAGDAYVVVNSSATSPLLAKADQTNGSIQFNGDDALVLRSGGIAGTVVDSFGQVGFDPGDYWGTLPDTTLNHTLRRKVTVTAGDTTPGDVFSPAAEWTFHAQDTFDGLGTHVVDCGCELDVLSPHGQSDPTVGAHFRECGTAVRCTVTNSLLALGATQYVCRGWSGTGSAPVSGTGTNTGAFFLDGDSEVAWLWTTNFWLDTEIDGPGTLDTGDGWHANGSNVLVTALPATYYHVAQWSGDTNGTTPLGNSIQGPMSRARLIRAEIRANLAPMGTPEWWLASYGLTNDTFAAEELKDSDLDGHRNWQEHVAGTIPTNALSILLVRPGYLGGGSNKAVFWESITGRLYTINDSTNLLDAWLEIPGATNLPGTGSTMTNPMPASPAPHQFFDIRVRQAP